MIISLEKTPEQLAAEETRREHSQLAERSMPYLAWHDMARQFHKMRVKQTYCEPCGLYHHPNGEVKRWIKRNVK